MDVQSKQKDCRYGKKKEVRERDCKNMRSVSRRQSKILNTNRGKLHVIFFDIADAFGSLEHKIMLHEMEKLGIPQHYTEII